MFGAKVRHSLETLPPRPRRGAPQAKEAPLPASLLSRGERIAYPEICYSQPLSEAHFVAKSEPLPYRVVRLYLSPEDYPRERPTGMIPRAWECTRVYTVVYTWVHSSVHACTPYPPR